MRDAVTISLSGKDYPLLPTFGALSNFEDRYGSIAAHYARLADLTATVNARAYLVAQALGAAKESGLWDSRFAIDPDAAAKALFERGLWHESTVGIEIELVERMLWTPEQFLEKKAQRAEAAKAQETAAARMSALSDFLVSPPPT